MNLFGSLKELVSTVFRSSSGKQVTVIPASQTVGDSTISIPDMANTSQSMVLTTQAQTLTNKSINSASNTITNIVNANISASAAIDASKIADGTVSSTEFQYINSLTSNVQTQLDSKAAGPASSTDNALVRFDGTTGKLTQNSLGILSDTGVLTGLTELDIGTIILTSGNISSTVQIHLHSGTADIYLNNNGGASDSVQVISPSGLQLVNGTDLVFYDNDSSNTISVSVPANVASDRTPQIPDDTGNFVLTSATQTLTNKTISGASNTITNVSLTTGVTGTLPIGNGGSGQTTANAALNAFLPSQATNGGKALVTDGTNTSWTTVATAATATPTAQGLVTSYFPTIQSGVHDVVSADYTVLTTDGYLEVSMSTGASDRTLTLPSVASNAGRMLTIMKRDSGAGKVVVTRAGSDSINFPPSLVNTFPLRMQGESLVLVANNATNNWDVMSFSSMYNPNTTTGSTGHVDGLNGLKGFTDGASPVAGYVGEFYNDNFDAAFTTTQSGGSLGTGASRTLSAGTWLIILSVGFSANATGNWNSLQILLNTPSNTGQEGTDQISWQQAATGANTQQHLGALHKVTNSSGTVAVSATFNGTRTAGTLNIRGTIVYVRIR